MMRNPDQFSMKSRAWAVSYGLVENDRVDSLRGCIHLIKTCLQFLLIAGTMIRQAVTIIDCPERPLNRKRSVTYLSCRKITNMVENCNGVCYFPLTSIVSRNAQEAIKELPVPTDSTQDPWCHPWEFACFNRINSLA